MVLFPSGKFLNLVVFVYLLRNPKPLLAKGQGRLYIFPSSETVGTFFVSKCYLNNMSGKVRVVTKFARESFAKQRALLQISTSLCATYRKIIDAVLTDKFTVSLPKVFNVATKQAT